MKNLESEVRGSKNKAQDEPGTVSGCCGGQSVERGLRRLRPASLVVSLFIASLLLLASRPLARAQDQFRLDWWSVNAGGGTSSDAQFAVSGTLGQRGVGVMTGGPFMLAGGLWWAVELPAPTAPLLGARLSGNKVVLSWPASEQGCTLETTGDLGDASSWNTLSLIPVIVGSQDTVTIPIQAGSHFYRLRRQ